MEINNENLINQATRLREKSREISKTPGSTGEIKGRSPKEDRDKGIEAQKNASPTISDKLQNNLNNHVRTLDVTLKKIQNQLTQNQHVLHSLNELESTTNGLNGQEFLQEVKNNNKTLASFLKEQNKEFVLEKADASQVQIEINNLIQDMTKKNESLYVEMKQNLKRSEIEMENITASGLNQSPAGEKINQLINEYRANISLAIQEINPKNVDNLIS